MPAPVAIAAPGIERAMVAGFANRVEHVAEFDHVAAPATVADVDAGPRHAVDRAVADRDLLGQVDFHAGDLLLDLADVVDERIANPALGRIIIRISARACDRLCPWAASYFPRRTASVRRRRRRPGTRRWPPHR